MALNQVSAVPAGVLRMIPGGFFTPTPAFLKEARQHLPNAHALRYGHRKFGDHRMYICGEWALRRWHWIKFQRYLAGVLRVISGGFWPQPMYFRRGPPTIFQMHMPSGMGAESLGIIGCIFAENGPLAGGIESSFSGTGWGAKGDFRWIFDPTPAFFERGPPLFSECSCPQV